MTPAEQRELARSLGATHGIPLSGLTLRRPWPSAIFDLPPEGWHGYQLEDHEVGIGPKRIENRGHLPPRSLLDEYIAIHAGLGYDEVEWPGLRPPAESECPTGIVGIARVVGALDRRMARSGMRRRVPVLRNESDRELARRLTTLDRDEWWTGPVGWLLEDPIAIEPVDCRGYQGVWPVPPAVAAEVWRRVEQVRPRGARGGV